MLKIIGDVCLADGYFDQGDGIGTRISNGENPFKYLPRGLDDFFIGNYESSASRNAKGPFLSNPTDLDDLPHMDLYGLANNHIMQNGKDGEAEVVKFLDSKKILHIGDINNKSIIFEHQSKKVGVLAFSMRPDNFVESPDYWHLPDLVELQAEIEKLKDCNYKIAYVHWGYEFINYPNIEQHQLGHFLIDSGVDLVVGMHPHVIQGYEDYRGGRIYYSLGNAVFNMAWEPTRYGLMVNVDFAETYPKLSHEYLWIGEDYFPRVVDVVPEHYTMEYLNRLVDKRIENEKYFAEVRKFNSAYTKANRLRILRRISRMPLKEQGAMIKDFVSRRILK